MMDLPKSNSPFDDYLLWEMTLLRELGFALDLTKCSGCAQTANLAYLSPKTGRAVCAECAEPYKNRLFRLPLTLDITINFLEKICDELGAKVPNSRATLTHKKNS